MAVPVATSLETERYWLSLGKFASRYAEVEAQLNRLVWHFYGIDRATVIIILNGALRVDAAFNHLERLKQAGRIGTEWFAEIEDLKQQLGILTRLRNDIFHFGATETEDGLHVTNIDYAITQERVRVHARYRPPCWRRRP